MSVVATSSLSVLATLVHVCGRVPPITHQGVLDVLRKDVSETFRECTFGRVVLPPDSVRVVEAPVEVPCPGAGTDACPTDAWGAAVDAVTKPAPGVHRVYVLPDEAACNFGGLGYVNCANERGATCRVWINGGVANSSDTYVHELGHNLGLNHAKSRDFAVPGGADIPYGDASDAMGSCCDVRCFNAPHLEQLGVLEARLRVLKSSDVLGEGVTVSLSGLRKQYVRLDTPTQAIYVQYRQRHGKDAGMQAEYGDAVNVYTVGPGERAERGFPYTMLETRLRQPNHAWLSYDGVTVTLVGIQGNNATVHLKTVR